MTAISLTTRTKLQQCPVCSSPISAATDPDGLDLPTSGDLTVCMYCLEVLEFGQDLKLKKFDQASIPHDQMVEIRKVINAIETARDIGRPRGIRAVVSMFHRGGR